MRPAPSRKKNGIDRPVPWSIRFCPVCGGSNRKCKFCKGENTIPVYRCIRSFARGNIVYHWDRYEKLGGFPDDKGALFQPVKLIAAFRIIKSIVNEYTKPEDKEE